MLCPELHRRAQGWPGLTLIRAGLVSASASGPSACCLPCLSLSSASAFVGRVWQTRGFAQQTGAAGGGLSLGRLWGQAHTQLGADRRRHHGARKNIKIAGAGHPRLSGEDSHHEHHIPPSEGLRIWHTIYYLLTYTQCYL